MDLITLNKWGEYHWEQLTELYPKLVKFDMPKLILSNRIYRTAGQCFQEDRTIHISNKLFIKPSNHRAMWKTILPHELIHQVDWDLYGISEKKCGHGKNWCAIMENYGLYPAIHHSLTME